jgi:hypothetical protein
MGKVNKSGIGFGGVPMEKTYSPCMSAPCVIPQKAELQVKPSGGFRFDPYTDGEIVNYSGFPVKRVYTANEKRKAVNGTERRL